MKRKYKSLYLLFVVLFSVVEIPSCISVKENHKVKGYQKKYLNDAEMELSARKSERFENNFQSYREGASGANGGKTGGGCGCN